MPKRCPYLEIQSGDCADSVTALQNLAVMRAVPMEEDAMRVLPHCLDSEDFCGFLKEPSRSKRVIPVGQTTKPN